MRQMLIVLAISSVLHNGSADAQSLDINKMLDGRKATLPPISENGGFDYLLPPTQNLVDFAKGLPPPSHWGVPHSLPRPATQDSAIYLMNSGTVDVSVAFVSSASQICAEVTIQPAETQTLQACGKYIAWNDTRNQRAMAIVSGHAYQIYWAENAWAIKDVSNDLFGSE